MRITSGLLVPRYETGLDGGFLGLGGKLGDLLGAVGSVLIDDDVSSSFIYAAFLAATAFRNCRNLRRFIY
jgi:hypothetical protein